MRFTLDSGAMRFSLRESANGAYTAILNVNGQVALYRGSTLMGSAVVLPTTPGQWRTLRLSAVDNIVRVRVDGVEVIAAQETIPLPFGTLSFASVGGGTLTVDDVALYVPADQVQPTETAVPTMTATAIATATATLLPEPPLNLVYSESFVGGQDPARSLRPMGKFVRVGTNLALQVTGDNSPTRIVPHVAHDVALQSMVLLNTGTAQLVVRQRPEGAYTAVMDTTGQVVLLKSGQPMASAVVPGFTPTQWHIFRLSATNNTVRVSVDNVEIIAVSDPEPLGEGYVSFGGDDLLIDDIQVWSGGSNDGEPQAMTFSAFSASMSSTDYTFAPGESFTIAGRLNDSDPNGIVVFDGESNLATTVIQPGVGAASFLDGVWNPVWSPDQTQLAFGCSTDVSFYSVCLATLDAATLEQPSEIVVLTQDTENTNEHVANWSPDGQFVLLRSHDIIGNTQLIAQRVVLPYDRITLLSDAALTFGDFFLDQHWGVDGYIYFSTASLFDDERVFIYQMQVIDISQNPPQLGSISQIAHPGVIPFMFSNMQLFQVYNMEVNGNGHMLFTVVQSSQDPAQPLYVTYIVLFNGGYSIMNETSFGFHDSPKWSPLNSSDFGFVSAPISNTLHISNIASPFNPIPIVLSVLINETQSPDFDWTVRPAKPDCSAVAEGDGIAFTFDNGRETDIYVTQSGGTCRKLTGVGNDSDPTISPDGTRVAYVKDGGIRVINIDGTNPVQLIDTPFEDDNPTWSPDSTQIGYTSDGDIYVLNLADFTTRRLTDNFTGGQNLAWSPDGTWIAYDYFDDIYLVNATCAASPCETFNLTDSAPFFEMQPSWSPDGGRIAFAGRDDSSPTYDVFIANITLGVNPTFIIDTQLTTNPADDIAPTWSPDGGAIAFQSDRDGLPALYANLSNAQSDILTPIVTGGSGAFEPDWMRQIVADCDVLFTNICFNDEHAALKSLMFWAIFHETSEDRYYSGHDIPVIGLEHDASSRNLIQFLTTSPYCAEDNTNTAPDEQLPGEWHHNIFSIEHCEDHRYLESQALINRFINRERRFFYDAAYPESLMQLAYVPLYEGYAGSIGTGDNALWIEADVKVCSENEELLPTNAPRLPTRGENRNLFGLSNDYDSGEDTEYYFYKEIVKNIANSTGEVQRAWRWMAVRWLDGYLACKLYIPLDRFPASQYLTGQIKLTAPRIMAEIQQAIDDFYAGISDSTNGAYDIKAANRYADRDGDGQITDHDRQWKPVELAICIGGCSNAGSYGAYLVNITDTNLPSLAVSQYHDSTPYTSACVTETDMFNYDDVVHDHIDQVRNCYWPSYATVVHPTLFYDFNGYKWVSIIYQQSQNTAHMPRYEVDICTINPDIVNCN